MPPKKKPATKTKVAPLPKLAQLERAGVVDLRRVKDPAVRKQIERILTKAQVKTLIKFKKALPGSKKQRWVPKSDGSVF